jgi:hypothetical protein
MPSTDGGGALLGTMPETTLEQGIDLLLEARRREAGR